MAKDGSQSDEGEGEAGGVLSAQERATRLRGRNLLLGGALLLLVLLLYAVSFVKTPPGPADGQGAPAAPAAQPLSTLRGE